MSVNIYNSNPNATSEEENFSRVADRGSKLASDTIYSNTTSGLNSVNVQGAIDEVNEKVDDNVEAISQINSDLTVSQQVLTGTLASGVNLIQPTGTFTLTNCYIAKVDYLVQGQWRDATIVGVQPWIDITQGIDIYGSSAMPSSLVGLPFRCILRKL